LQVLDVLGDKESTFVDGVTGQMVVFADDGFLKWGGIRPMYASAIGANETTA
jgi:hypothetical protein